MPNNKKSSFIVYNDSQEVFTELSNENAGKLIKAMIEYSSSGTQIEMCPMLKLAFIPIRQQMDRNIEKYVNICDRNKKNGSLGGRPKNPNNPVGILVTQNNPEKPKKPDTDTDKDNDMDKEKELLPKGNNAKAGGNFLVNSCIENFTNAIGFQPTDKKPRNEAFNLIRRIKKTVIGYGKEPSDYNIGVVITKYFQWIAKQEWGEKIQLMGTARLKYPIYESLLKDKKNV